MTVRGAKINLLDALVACAVVICLPRIIQETRRANVAVLFTWAFLLSMAISFILGVRDPDAAFFAIREVRALAFYVLALAFATAGCKAQDFRVFATAYVIGTVIASVAAFAHLFWGMPLPGYSETPLQVPWTNTLRGVTYLQWTTPVTAFVLGLVGIMAARSRVSQAGWVLALFVLAWYIFAAAERFAQVVTIFAVAIILTLPMGERGKSRRALAIAVVLGICAILAIGAQAGGTWVSTWSRYTALRWSVAFRDGSFAYRMREFIAGVTLMARNPLLGMGLGERLPIAPPSGPIEPWHYASSGYTFLLSRSGLLGTALYLWMSGTSLVTGWRAVHTTKDGEFWPVRAAGMAGMITLLAANLLHPVVDIPEGVIAFSLFFGMLVSRDEVRGGGRSATESAIIPRRA